MYKSIDETEDTWKGNIEKTLKEFTSQNFNQNLSSDDLMVLQKFMHYNCSQITPSQIRNIYNLIIDKSKTDANKRIKLAYVAGRTDKTKKGMIIFIEKVEGMVKNSFQGIEHFVEACLAYHKYYYNIGINYSRENNNTNKKTFR